MEAGPKKDQGGLEPADLIYNYILFGTWSTGLTGSYFIGSHNRVYNKSLV